MIQARAMMSSALCFRAIPFLIRGPDYDSRWGTQKGADQSGGAIHVLLELAAQGVGE